MEGKFMRAAKNTAKSRTITIDDYYNERFLRLEIEMKHLREDFNRRFEAVDKRFETIDKRFEDMRDDMNRRFESVDKRFDALTTRIDRFMIWSFGMTFTSTGLIIAAMKFWK